ncbi:2'-5' RNA ligase family protein [Colwellia sp. RE-S-Sl-9]
MDMLEKKYNAMWETSQAHFADQGVDIDPNLYSNYDNRKGITVIAKFSSDLGVEINQLFEKLKCIEPKQYYYSENELHLTVLSLISCNENFTIEQININQYKSLISESVVGIKPFEVRFKGITASSSCIMLQGFPLDDSLLYLRNNLRKIFAQSGLFNTIDERYKIDTAHSTAIRFRHKLEQMKEFIQLLEQFRKLDLGVLHVKELQLVYNDWYHKEDNTVILSTIKL